VRRTCDQQPLVGACPGAAGWAPTTHLAAFGFRVHRGWLRRLMWRDRTIGLDRRSHDSRRPLDQPTAVVLLMRHKPPDSRPPRSLPRLIGAQKSFLKKIFQYQFQKIATGYRFLYRFSKYRLLINIPSPKPG